MNRRHGLALVRIAAAALVAAVALREANADRYPYRAVAPAGTAIYAGPGNEFYATAQTQGDLVVEVYHEDDRGWCAIRPPVGSYSWVAARRFRLLEEDASAECLRAGVPSFVGSDASPSRDAIAVRLKKGERVAVLGREEAGGQTWLKIAPPSGEFRWVERKRLRPLDANDPAPAKAAEGVAEPSPADAAAAPVEKGESASVQEPSATSQATASDEPASQEPADGVQGAMPEGKSQTSKPTPPAKLTAANAEFWTQAVAIDLELAAMAAREPDQWKFADLRRDAQTLYDRAKNDDQYDAARHLLGKLARFESIRRERIDLEERIARSKADDPIKKTVAAANPDKAPGSAAVSSPAGGAAAGDDSRYDARGRLVAVQSVRAGAAPYAVLDEKNQVRTYISPGPQVNLQAYVGRVVGINGVANPATGGNHVVAQRVDVLGGPVRK